MNNVRRFLFVLVLLAVVAAGVWYVGWYPCGPRTETFVEIAPGTSSAGIAQQLQKAGVIRSRFAFEAMRAFKGGSLKAGEYRFDHPAPLGEVYSRIRRGDVYTRTVVIPEGYNIFDIARTMQQAGLANQQEFLQAEMHDTQLIREWSPNATSLEGFLFPDTYRFSRRATPLDILAAMVKRFTQEATRAGLKPEEAEKTVTMASLVEREVHLPSERAAVAGVFENRLTAGMPLQTDPSVVYASLLAGTWTGVIHESELHSDSPYNTYTHTGLPPGPICNPGLASIKAAMHPQASDYLYFVADANGATRFAATLQQHNANVAQYRAAIGEAPLPPQLPPPPAPPRAVVSQKGKSRSREHRLSLRASREPRHRPGRKAGRSTH